MTTACRTLFATVFLFVALSRCYADGSAEALKALQGTWTGVEAGKEDKGKCTLKIDGKAVHFQGWSKQEWYKGSIKLVVDKKPYQMHGTITDCPEPDFVGKTSLAIYKIKKGTLTLVGRRPGDPEGPTGFDDKKARRFVLEKAPANKDSAGG